MDGILNIFQILSEVDAIQLPKYLNALVEHQSFRQKVSVCVYNLLIDGTRNHIIVILIVTEYKILIRRRVN